MKWIAALAAAALLGVPAICAEDIVSLRPLAAANNPALVFEPALLGNWEGDLEITRGKDNTYKAVFDDDKTKGTVRLVKLGDALVFDFQLEDMPLHAFGKLRVEGDTMTAWFMDTGWLRDQITARGLPRHEVLDNGWLVLTATSEELWTWLALPYMNDQRAFSSPWTLARRPAPQESEQPAVSTADTPAARRYDLTGIWYNPAVPDYEISIALTGDSIVATKTRSSEAVPAGKVSIQGAFVSDSTLKAQLKFAGPGYTDPSWGDVTLVVQEGGNRITCRGSGVNAEFLRR
jgi:hypothetical protein